jgi:predicted RNA binding protein YcfA (HicA-like mRNA interferase family)
VPKIPGVNHLNAVRALEKVGFQIIRQGKHIVMSDGVRILTIPRHNPVNAFTMGGIVRDAGLSVEEFKKLLQRYMPSNNSLNWSAKVYLHTWLIQTLNNAAQIVRRNC